jgi:hypothetical protein
MNLLVNYQQHNFINQYNLENLYLLNFFNIYFLYHHNIF